LRSGEVRVFRAREVLRLWLRASASGRRCRGDTDGRLAALKEAMLAVESAGDVRASCSRALRRVRRRNLRTDRKPPTRRARGHGLI
jgi:hypothetical protein